MKIIIAGIFLLLAAILISRTAYIATHLKTPTPIAQNPASPDQNAGAFSDSPSFNTVPATKNKSFEDFGLIMPSPEIPIPKAKMPSTAKVMEKVATTNVNPESVIIPPPSSVSPPVETIIATAPETVIAPLPSFPTIDIEKIKLAVTRVRCDRTFGSGFVIKRDDEWYVLTAAHVVINQIDVGKTTCDVIFPRKDNNGNFKEAYYRIGEILAPAGVTKKYKDEAVDLAILKILPLLDPRENAAVFPDGYPTIDYQFCTTRQIGDFITLLGYASNLGTALTPGAFLSEFTGDIVGFADVTGVAEKRSDSFRSGYSYIPILVDNDDANVEHPITIVVSNNNFFGASGGLVLDRTQNCIVGVNIATSVRDNQVFGFATNPLFEPTRAWAEGIIRATIQY